MIEELVKQILGPVGLTIGAVLALYYIVNKLFEYIKAYIESLFKHIAYLEARNEDLKGQLKDSTAGWAAQTEANRVLADAQAARNRDDEMRHRLEDVARGRKP